MSDSHGHEFDWVPRFQPGATVTAASLNRVVEMFSAMGRFEAQHFHGHGILHGLRARIEGGHLRVEPGFAVTRRGERVQVKEALCLDLDLERPNRIEEVVHPQVARLESRIEGYTPLLCLCEHSLHDRREVFPGLHVVRGRVRVDDSELFGRLRPLSPLEDLRAPVGFRDAYAILHERILSEIDGDGIAHANVSNLLGGLSDSMSEGIVDAADLLKVAAVNDLVYTLWQRERARCYLDARPALFDDGIGEVVNGVPLGWLYKVGTTWHWDGRWRAGFALGLSRLQLLGYCPASVSHLCDERIRALLTGLGKLQERAQAQRDATADTSRWPAVWHISPEGYDTGTEAWLRELRSDRPQRTAAFWALDPLRGSREGPAIAVPGVRDEHDPRPRPKVRAAPIRHPAPSVIDPVNDPFTFCSYLDAARVDPTRAGALAVAGLIGFPAARVWGAIARCTGPNGIRMRLAPTPVSIHDELACRGLEFVMVASFAEVLTVVTDGGERGTVVGFARAVDQRTPREAEHDQERPSFLRWLFSR